MVMAELTIVLDILAVVTLAAGGLAQGLPPTLDGYSMIDALQRLEKEGAACVGLNCGRGPKTMIPLIKELRPHIKVSGDIVSL